MPDAPAPPITVRGARVHNLKDVSVEFPAGKLTVLSGVSGSGKSSLAFDTVYAEGQRRFLATASPKARAAVARLDRPDVDAVENLPPVLAVTQSDPTAGPRSTLATLTGLHDLFRLLWAGAGVPHDLETGAALVRHTVRQIVDEAFALSERTKLMVLAPAGEATGGGENDAALWETVLKDGFVRCEVGGELFETADLAAGDAAPTGPVAAVVDRAVVKPGAEDRVRESVDLAAARSGGTVKLLIAGRDAPGGWATRVFRTRLTSDDGGELRPPDPLSFSFHSPRGACPDCGGTGLADPDAKVRRAIVPAACGACGGRRLNPASLAVRVDGLEIGDAATLSVDAAAGRFANLSERAAAGDADLSAAGPGVCDRLLPDVHSRLDALRRVGLGYLTLDRRTRTLSGGEFRRARLAGCLGERVTDACFVLDEPTVGLHPADADRLWHVLTELRDAGNTVLLVEHDPALIRRADHLVELGPGAGADGGEIVDAGPPAAVLARGTSPTARALSEARESSRESTGDTPALLSLTDARLHSLAGVTLRVPHGRLTAVTGVSGSGKSTLVAGLLVPAVRATLSPTASPPPTAFYGELTGLDPIAKLAEVDQRRLGGSSRSCPATASGVWKEVRGLLARTRDARRLGFSASRFSPASKTGHCPECRGRGFRAVRADFLPTATTPCPRCRGARFNPQTLLVRWKGHTAADLLAMRAGEAAGLFADVTPVARVLGTFAEVGLGYLPLGQPADTLSGGEAQRVRLAAALADPGFTPTLFVLDEPTAGLHPLDVARLTDLLARLAGRGHTVLCVEHDVDLIRRCDRVVELGPGAGPDGGRIVAEGSPAEVAANLRHADRAGVEKRRLRDDRTEGHQPRARRGGSAFVILRSHRSLVSAADSGPSLKCRGRRSSDGGSSSRRTRCPDERTTPRPCPCPCRTAGPPTATAGR